MKLFRLFVVLILLVSLPLMFLSGCAKKQEAEQQDTEQIEEQAPADTTVPPPPESDTGAAPENK